MPIASANELLKIPFDFFLKTLSLLQPPLEELAKLGVLHFVKLLFENLRSLALRILHSV